MEYIRGAYDMFMYKASAIQDSAYIFYQLNYAIIIIKNRNLFYIPHIVHTIFEQFPRL